MNSRAQQLKMAERGAITSIITYTFLAVVKIGIGRWGHSEALTADGWNNFTDILGSIFVLVGLRLSRKPKDSTHQYGHWKIEAIASLLTSIVMFLVGLNVLIPTISRMIHHKMEKPDMLSCIVGFAAGAVMFIVYSYNKHLAQRVQSQSLMAAAKDNLSDALTSIGTGIAIVASMWGLPWLDNLTALIIGFIIIKTALEIFNQSSFELSDGFNQKDLDEYENCIRKIPGVDGVRQMRGRRYGANIFLDVVVYMNPEMTVRESHHITETIEHRLHKNFDIFDTDVHVEPTPGRQKEDK